MAGCSIMLAIGLFLLVTGVGAGPYGAYIGCFDINSMGLRSENLQVLLAASGQQAVQYCSSTCTAGGFSLTIISPDYGCRCAGITPPLSAKLAESACAAGGNGVAVFYNHASSDTQSCTLQELPLSNTTGVFSVAYNPQNVVFGGAAGPGVMQLQLAGTEGTRVEYKGASTLYGQTQVTASIPCASGVISAFYLRSSDIYADLATMQAAADMFSEIDFEFLSFNDDLYGLKPCSVWLNTFKEAVTRGEMLVSQSEYQSALGWPSTQSTCSTTWVTYTINWQPNFVSWSMNGKVMRTLHTGDATKYWGTEPTTYQTPDLPMHPVFTMWTDTRSQFAFGGKIDPTQGPQHASFKDMRHIVCSSGAPSSSVGPSWLYSGMCNPAGTAWKSCHSKAAGGVLL